MGRTRTVVSKKNPYYLPKHRTLELKHFCLQYHDFSKLYFVTRTALKGREKESVLLADLSRAMELIEDTAFDTDEVLGNYILLSVVDEISYENLRSRYSIPCGKEYFYQTKRKFFWLLSERKGI